MFWKRNNYLKGNCPKIKQTNDYRATVYINIYKKNYAMIYSSNTSILIGA